MKINQTQTRNWVRRIAIAAVSVLIGGAAIAHGQCTDCAGGYQSSFPRCQLGRHLLTGQQGLAGGAGGFLEGAKQNAALLRHRETPPGNMGLHFPYNATQMYYYRRPYNDFHVPTHVSESRHGATRSTFGRGLGYSNQIFEQVHKSTEQYYNSYHGSELDKDGLLEFVDWRDHQQQRRIWESMPRYHSEYRDGSLPYSNEEVMDRKSKDNPDYQDMIGSAPNMQRNLQRNLIGDVRTDIGFSTRERSRDSSFQRRVSSLQSQSGSQRHKRQ